MYGGDTGMRVSFSITVPDRRIGVWDLTSSVHDEREGKLDLLPHGASVEQRRLVATASNGGAGGACERAVCRRYYL